MSQKTVPQHGDAYVAIRHIYDKSPGRSWRRLNSALQGALYAAIEAHLSFLPDDFSAIRRDMNGGYWMGNSTGSTCGEGYYTYAVKVGHAPACISFERYAGRPAALWSENVKTPGRLCIGSRFTWKGELLDVTNMSTDHLIACAYENRPPSDGLVDVGDLSHFAGGYRRIEKLKILDSGAWRVQFSADHVEYSRKPSKIVRITYEELAVARKQLDAARREALRTIEAAKNEQDLKAFEEHFDRRLYRTFDIKDFGDALYKKRQVLRQEAA
jgi:hypothetical protein